MKRLFAVMGSEVLKNVFQLKYVELKMHYKLKRSVNKQS